MPKSSPSMVRLIVLTLGAAGIALTPLAARGQEGPAPEVTTPTLGLYKPDAGPMAVRVIDEAWHDAARDREIPVRIYQPMTRPTPDVKGDAPPSPLPKCPVILLSHGLGGSRSTYGYFGEHLASHGYIVIAPTHRGSDTAAAAEWFRAHGGVRGRLRERDGDETGGDQPGGWLMTSINSPDNLRNRPKDISFVIDQIATHKVLEPLADMDRIGVAGHSFGAHTAMCVGGMTVEIDGKPVSSRDPRIKAVLPMSPEGAGSMGIVKGAWEKFGVPVLFLTGTKDFGPGNRAASWRRQGFDAVHGVDDYLITLNGAGHMTFADTPLARDPDQAHHVLMIKSVSTAFFDAYLRPDAKAAEWLRTFTMPKRGDCVAEFKPAAAPKREP